MSEPLVSIVTPTLNRAEYLGATLRSVRDQTYRRIEHIVVDGGSNDGSLALLKEHEGTYGLRWTTEPDRGMYDAINKGMRDAAGEVLAYLNSDDLYLPWTVATVVEYFDTHPDVGFVFGDALNVDESGAQTLVLQPPFDLRSIRRSAFLVQPTVFWRRQAFQVQGPFDASFKLVADCEYWMRAGSRWSFGRVDEVLAVEQDHAGTHRTKRGAELTAEITLLRKRYALPSPLQLLGIGRDRVRAAAWRRILLARFLWAAASKRPKGRRRWRAFLGSGALSIRWPNLVLALIPAIGARFSRGAFRWEQPT